MSVGGTVYICCEGEEVLGVLFCARDGLECVGTSRDLDLGFYPDSKAAAEVARALLIEWRTVLALRVGGARSFAHADLCPGCMATWRRVSYRVEEILGRRLTVGEAASVVHFFATEGDRRDLGDALKGALVSLERSVAKGDW